MAPKKETGNDKADRGKRTYKRREGEFLKGELVAKILAHPNNTKKKSHLSKLGKRELCDVASSLGIINESEHLASLARRSEGRKCYFWTLLQDAKLRLPFDAYVQWWSEIWARGTIIANAFACSTDNVTAETLSDLTRLKTMMYPERPVNQEMPDLATLAGWMASPARQYAFEEMLPAQSPCATVIDQALTYMARRYRGNIKNHLLVHLHPSMFKLFKRMYSGPRGVNDGKVGDLGVPCERAIVTGNVDNARLDVNIRWRIIKMRDFLGLGPDDVAGNPYEDGSEEAVMIANANEDNDGADDEDAGAPGGLATAWIVHKKLCKLGLSSMLPLSTPSRSHAIIDKRIAFFLIKEYNKQCTKASDKVAMSTSEDKVMTDFFLPSRRQQKTAKAHSRRQANNRTRKQFKKSGCTNIVPKHGVLKTISTDGVSATATFDVPIVHRQQVLLKKDLVRGILDRRSTSCDCHSGACCHHDCESGPSTSAALLGPVASKKKIPIPIMSSNGRVLLSSKDVAALPSTRLISDDPGEVNVATTVELGSRWRHTSGHREIIHNQMSRRRYESRTMKKSHQQWEASRRQDNLAYRCAIHDMSRAGTWKTSDVDALDRMVDTCAKGWVAMKRELIVDKEHVRRKMLMYRKRRMVLDQTAQRITNPTNAHVINKSKRGVILGIGQAVFKSKGPNTQLLKALIRAMKRMRAEGRPAFIVFVDEYLTTQLCHKCYGKTTSPRKKVKNKPRMKIEDHRFRDCPHCGSQAAPKRWGRDTNVWHGVPTAMAHLAPSTAALNILRNLKAILMGVEPPEEFRRPRNQDNNDA